jgi:hypothetical protein
MPLPSNNRYFFTSAMFSPYLQRKLPPGWLIPKRWAKKVPLVLNPGKPDELQSSKLKAQSKNQTLHPSLPFSFESSAFRFYPYSTDTECGWS